MGTTTTFALPYPEEGEVNEVPADIQALAEGVELALSLQPLNTQADAYQLVAGDAGKVVEMNKATAVAVTIPTNATVAFPVGTLIGIYAMGAGVVTITPAGGVTVRGVLTLNQYDQVLLRKRATNEWVVEGLNATYLPLASRKIVRKTADTSRASTTTRTADPDLQFAVLANETWDGYFAVIIGAGDEAADMILAVTAPSGATVDVGVFGLAAAATNYTGDVTAVGLNSDPVIVGLDNTEKAALLVFFSVAVAATPGTVSLDWAQGASSGTATVVKRGSHLVAHRQ